MRRRYLEYDRLSGKILSEVFAEESDAAQYENETRGVLQIDDGILFVFGDYIVMDGKLQAAYLTTQQRREAEGQRQELRAKASKMMRSLLNEFSMALIEDNQGEQARLKEEWKLWKARL